jgi:hypothetical protein
MACTSVFISVKIVKKYYFWIFRSLLKSFVITAIFMEGILVSKEKITERFLELTKIIINKYNLATQKVFAESINVENHHISNLNIGKSQVNAWMISSLVNTYAEVNPDYILTGKGAPVRDTGPMFKTSQNMKEYIDLLQQENGILRKQIEALQVLLLEKLA